MQRIVRDYKKGIAGTVITHVIILLIIFLFGFRTPLPLPEEEGLLVNFGFTDQGYGFTEPAMRPVAEASEQRAAPQEIEEAMITQDFEESPTVAEKKNPIVKKEDKNAPVVKTNEEKKTKEKEYPKTDVQPEETPRIIDTKSLFPGKKNNGGESEGIIEGTGNQGIETGTENSSNYIGTGGGSSVSFSLEGRRPVNLVRPDYQYQKGGIVVVEIIVTKEGLVREARAGVKGSTTTDSYLCNVAEMAAKKSKFDVKPDAPAEQRGTITYHFKLE